MMRDKFAEMSADAHAVDAGLRDMPRNLLSLPKMVIKMARLKLKIRKAKR